MQDIDPKNDVVFMRIFGEHKDILTGFLNAMLPLPHPTDASLRHSSFTLGELGSYGRHCNAVSTAKTRKIAVENWGREAGKAERIEKGSRNCEWNWPRNCFETVCQWTQSPNGQT